MQDKHELIIEQIPRLRRYARALTRDPVLADDLVQDCLERAWSRFHLWRRGSNLRAWLFTILHNQHANLVRQQKRRPILVPLNPGETERAVAPAQEHAVEINQLAVALDQLPDEQRAVLLLVGLEEMTYAEAAKILEIPIGTVMSRLSRGRERLRLLVADPKAGTQQTKS